MLVFCRWILTELKIYLSLSSVVFLDLFYLLDYIRKVSLGFADLSSFLVSCHITTWYQTPEDKDMYQFVVYLQFSIQIHKAPVIAITL